VATSVNAAGTTAIKSEPNVIPMIDIMLVLLIIFMIVTPLIANGFKATMPQGTNLEKRPEGDGEVVLGIDAAGGYFVNGVAIPAAALEDQLKSIFSQRPEDKVLYFRADKDLPFSKIQDAVETARKAGVAVMAAITEVKPSGKGLFDLPKEK
jgi:biopolymer transport protein TolR